MKTHKDKFVPAFEVTPVKEENLADFAQRLHDMGVAANDLRSQLSRFADTLGDKDLKRQAEALRTWMDINSEGLAVAAHAAELGAGWAEETRKRLEAAATDLRQIQDGSPQVSKNPQSEAEAGIAQIWSDVNNVLDSMEALYRPPGISGCGEKIVEPSHMFAR
jgi:transposase